MAKKVKTKKQNKKAGLPPGSIVYTGSNNYNHDLEFNLIAYNNDSFFEINSNNFNDLKEHFGQENMHYWLNINALHHTQLIEEVGKYFNISPLILEDVVNTNQRSKFDHYTHFSLISIKIPEIDPASGSTEFEQLSIVFNKNIVLSFQEKPSDFVAQLIERIKDKVGMVHLKKSDYLAYRLLDLITDMYIIDMDKLEEQIEVLEEESENTAENLAPRIKQLRKIIIGIRKKIIGLAEISGSLQNGLCPFVDPENYPYLADVKDHTQSLLDRIDNAKEELFILSEAYNSNLNLKMNNIVKLLTIISTIFIPLTFIVGIYGMNFENMPELSWPNGYPLILGIMLVLSLVMLVYFKRKKWL